METNWMYLGEKVYFKMDFYHYLEVDENITAVSNVNISVHSSNVTSPTMVTQTNVVFTNKDVKVQLSGGESGVVYEIKVTVDTSNQNTFIGEGLLKVV